MRQLKTRATLFINLSNFWKMSLESLWPCSVREWLNSTSSKKGFSIEALNVLSVHGVIPESQSKLRATIVFHFSFLMAHELHQSNYYIQPFFSVFNTSATWKDVCQKYETSLKANFLKCSTFSTTFPCRRYCSSFDCYLNGGVFNMKKNRQTKIYSSTWEIHRNVCGLTKCRIFPSPWSTSSDSVFSKIFFPLRNGRFVLITPKNVFSLKWRAIVGMGRKCPISFILLLGDLYLFRWLNNPY